MDDFGLSSIHTWLWAELDNLGIDSVIYSRHILDLFISSKYSTDFYLAKKEKSIFDLIIPTSRKRKHRYSRRSNSFSNNCTEEVAWKKQIAITCLKSAVDSSSGTNTMKSIQRLVDEIYKKLTDLRLTPDSMQKESEISMRSANSEKNQRKNNMENYDQAFPTLSPSNSPSQQISKADKLSSSWPKFTKFNDKSTTTSTKTSGIQSKENFSDKSLPYYRKKENGKFTKKSNYSYSMNSKPLKEKFRSSSSTKHTRQSPYKFNRNFKKRPGYYTTQHAPEKFKSQKPSTKGTSGYYRKGVKPKHNAGVNNRSIWKNETQYYDVDNKTVQEESVFQHKYADRVDYSSCAYDANASNDTADENTVSSKWFRDPETGLLTFEPRYQQLEKAKSCYEISEFDHLQCVNGDCKATESWMWCPSPSFWTEDIEKPVEGKLNMQSRLHSVYQQTDGNDEKNLDAIPSKFWKKYQSIFLNLDDESCRKNETESHDSYVRSKSASFDESSSTLQNDADDCVVVGFSIGLSLFDVEDNPYRSATGDFQEFEKKSKFAGFFNNSANNTVGSCCNQTNDQSPRKRERKKSVSIWNCGDEYQNSFGLGEGEFSEETLEILLNPGNFNTFADDVNACLFKGCFDWLNIYSDPYDCFLYDSKFDNLPINLELEEEFAVGSSKQNFLGLKSLKEDPFLESITNNDAWKTSLRIGTVWQSISGIRPVVVIYNEKVKTLQDQAVVPSDMTHFRPIHKMDINNTSKQSKPFKFSTKTTAEKDSNGNGMLLNNCSKDDLKSIKKHDLKDENDSIKDKEIVLEPSFKKLGKDKCLQTTFEKDFQSLQFEESNLR